MYELDKVDICGRDSYILEGNEHEYGWLFDLTDLCIARRWGKTRTRDLEGNLSFQMFRCLANVGH